MIADVRKELLQLADEEYRVFQCSLIPGLTEILGVRMPELRRIARKLARGGWEVYLAEASDTCYEELMIQGLVIGYAQMCLSDRVRYLQVLIPKISNWAVCDGCCAAMRFMRENSTFWFSFLADYLNCEEEFQVRFSVVCLLDHFIGVKDTAELLHVLEQVHHPGYYAKMAVAWAVSVCCARDPQITLNFLRQHTLDLFTHNKAIQKCRESRRISEEDKQRLSRLKRGR